MIRIALVNALDDKNKDTILWNGIYFEDSGSNAKTHILHVVTIVIFVFLLQEPQTQQKSDFKNKKQNAPSASIIDTIHQPFPVASLFVPA
jgi:hypothetical protein